jgi:uncharacterized protein YxjI
MSEQGPAAANWYPDPSGRHELRYYDGTAWTDHVADNGNQSIDPPGGPSIVPTVNRDAQQIATDLSRAGVAAASGGGTIFTEPVLVVSQKKKIIEINSEYGVFDTRGTQIAAVREVGQSSAKKVLRFVSNVDQFLTHKLQVVDMQGNVMLALTRPAKLMKSKIIVQDGQGRELGAVMQQNVIGKINFSFDVGGQTIGSINAENWRAWNFSIRDAAGTEVARITKTWEGLMTTMFTTADNYVVQMHTDLPEPLRSMVVASALCVDTALKQDQRGLN